MKARFVSCVVVKHVLWYKRLTVLFGQGVGASKERFL